MTCLLCSKKRPKNPGGRGYFQKNWEGVCGTLSETLSDQNLWFSLPYFRRDRKFDTLFQAWSPGAQRVTSCYGTYALIGKNIKREMVLSPNDEEVANSSKKHTQFKTRPHKPYPISDENCRIDTLFQNKTAQKNIPFGAAHTYIVYIRDYSPSPGRKTRCRLWVSLFTQARLIMCSSFPSSWQNVI